MIFINKVYTCAEVETYRKEFKTFSISRFFSKVAFLLC